MSSVKRSARKMLAKMFSSVMSVVPLKTDSILVIESSFPSGSNTRILSEQLKSKYQVEVIPEKEIYKPISGIGSIWNRLKILIHISTFPVIITSHGFNKLNRKQLLINPWHGIPLKAMAHMEANPSQSVTEFNMDHLVMTSKMQSVLMSACTHVEFARNLILGNPRNDYLYQTEISHLHKIAAKDQYAKVLLYMPTFRQGFGNRNEGAIADDIFNYGDSPQETAFIKFIEANNYLLIIKLHPQEEALLEEKFNKLDSPNILVLKNHLLFENDLDIYQLLPEVDMLITDYSSIYLDYLLTDKPMVFVNNDLEVYKETRGLILEPYDFWTPGYKAPTYEQLEQSITNSFGKDEYRQKRKELKDVFHLYQDGGSSARVIQIIDNHLSS